MKVSAVSGGLVNSSGTPFSAGLSSPTTFTLLILIYYSNYAIQLVEFNHA